MEISTSTLSSAITSEESVDVGWFSALGSEAVGWMNAPITSGANLLRNMALGAKELGISIRNGTFGQIFRQWAKDDPFAAAAGTIAAGLAASVVVIAGGAVIGSIVGSIGGAVGKLGVLGTLGSLGGLGAITGGIMNSAETVYSIDWQQSDEDIMKEINQAIDNLYEPAGDFMGRQLAGILVGGATAAPKVRINVKLAAHAWALNPEIREDLLNGISEFAYTGMTAFTQIAIKYAFLKGRQGIKSLAKEHPGLVEKISPKIAKQIEKWGEEDSKPWSIETEVNEQIEKIDNDRVQSAVEGFISGFWQQFRSSVEYVYN